MRCRIHKGTIVCFILGLLSLALLLPVTKNYILDLYESFRGYPLRLRDEWYGRLSRFCIFVPFVIFACGLLYQFFVNNVVCAAQNACKSLCDYVKQEQRQVVLVVLTSLIFGVIAHGFGFSNLILSHDSLPVFQGDIFGQLGLGRFMQPLYVHLFRGTIVTPYLITIFSLCFLSLATLLVIRILDINDTVSIVLTCGVMVTNLVVVLLIATYVNYVDLFMLSLLLSVLAVFVVHKYQKGFWAGVPLLVLSLGLYQAYIQVSACLFMFLVLRMILRKESLRLVLITGMKYVLTLLVSLALYYVLWKMLLFATGTQPGNSYNGLSDVGNYDGLASVAALFLQTYSFVGRTFLMPKTFHSVLVAVLNVSIIVVCLALVVWAVIQKQVRGWNLVIFIAIAILFPFGMNVVYFISKGVTHDLMIYSLFFVYIFALVMTGKAQKQGKFVRGAVGILVFCNIVFANQAYLKKDLEFQGSLAVMTRVIDRMEQVPGYVAGVTPVVFVGDINSGSLAVARPGFSQLYDAAGLGPYYSPTYDTYAYVREILGYPVVRWVVPDGFMEQEAVQGMGYFPAQDSCQLVDGVMVVKFSDPIYYD